MNDVFSRTSVRYIGSPQRIYNAKKLKLKRVQYRFNLKQFHIGGILCMELETYEMVIKHQSQLQQTTNFVIFFLIFEKNKA